MNIYTKILYCDKNDSDKVYIVTVNEIAKQYVVMTSWGARTADELTSKKKGEYTDQLQAIREANRLVSKKRTNYRDAPKDLHIIGYKPNAISTVHVLADSAQAATAMINEAIPTKRKITL